MPGDWTPFFEKSDWCSFKKRKADCDHYMPMTGDVVSETEARFAPKRHCNSYNLQPTLSPNSFFKNNEITETFSCNSSGASAATSMDVDNCAHDTGFNNYCAKASDTMSPTSPGVYQQFFATGDYSPGLIERRGEDKTELSNEQPAAHNDAVYGSEVRNSGGVIGCRLFWRSSDIY